MSKVENESHLFYIYLKISYFGLQNYGECWSGETAGQTYSRDGRAENCKSGVGLSQSTYFVYKFFDYGDKGKFFSDITSLAFPDLRRVITCNCYPFSRGWQT